MEKLLLVVPCYNESKRLDTEAVISYLDNMPQLKVLFVDDGSTDETVLLLQSLKNKRPEQIEILALRKNQGKAEAVRQGILAGLAKHPKFIGYWDADFSTPLSEIAEFLRIFATNERIELVMGSRVKLLGKQIERQALRHYLGRIFATFASLVLKLAVYDTQCGAKIFRVNHDTAAYFERPFHSRWVFDVELIARMIGKRQEPPVPQRIYELSLNEWRDVAGSKVRPKDFFVAFYELLYIRLNFKNL
jgi:glycosyltransferase involved in cell wall biosynthesis